MHRGHHAAFNSDCSSQWEHHHKQRVPCNSKIFSAQKLQRELCLFKQTRLAPWKTNLAMMQAYQSAKLRKNGSRGRQAVIPSTSTNVTMPVKSSFCTRPPMITKQPTLQGCPGLLVKPQDMTNFDLSCQCQSTVCSKFLFWNLA